MGVWTELLCCTAVPEVVLRHGTRAEFPENFHFFRFEELVRSTTAQSCENLLESTENEVESPSECRAAIVALLAILCISRSAFRMSPTNAMYHGIPVMRTRVKTSFNKKLFGPVLSHHYTPSTRLQPPFLTLTLSSSGYTGTSAAAAIFNLADTADIL